MEVEEYNEIMDLMIEQANSIIHHQRILNDIYSELDRNRDKPFEQDTIYRDQFGQFPSDSVVRDVDGVKISTRVLHQTGKGLSDIKGGDFLYEIEGVKYALVQYKKAGSSSFQVDSSQLSRLLDNCPSKCMYKYKKPVSVPTIMNGYCGCYYRVLTGADKSKLLPACEIESLLVGQNTISLDKISSGLSKDTFESLFASCRLGALTRVKKAEYYIKEALDQDHFLFYVLQNGKW